MAMLVCQRVTNVIGIGFKGGGNMTLRIWYISSYGHFNSSHWIGLRENDYRKALSIRLMGKNHGFR